MYYMIPGKIGGHDKLYQLNHHLGYFPSGGEKKQSRWEKKAQMDHMTQTALEAKDHTAKKRSINHLPNSNHHIFGNEMSWCCDNTSLVVFSRLIIWGTWFHFHAHLHHLLHLLWRHVFHHVAHGIHPRRWWELVEDWLPWFGLGWVVSFLRSTYLDAFITVNIDQ